MHYAGEQKQVWYLLHVPRQEWSMRDGSEIERISSQFLKFLQKQSFYLMFYIASWYVVFKAALGPDYHPRIWFYFHLTHRSNHPNSSENILLGFSSLRITLLEANYSPALSCATIEPSSTSSAVQDIVVSSAKSMYLALWYIFGRSFI